MQLVLFSTLMLPCLPVMFSPGQTAPGCSLCQGFHCLARCLDVHAAVDFRVAFWHDLWCFSLKLLLLFDATDDAMADDVPDDAEVAISSTYTLPLGVCLIMFFLLTMYHHCSQHYVSAQKITPSIVLLRGVEPLCHNDTKCLISQSKNRCPGYTKIKTLTTELVSSPLHHTVDNFF